MQPRIEVLKLLYWYNPALRGAVTPVTSKPGDFHHITLAHATVIHRRHEAAQNECCVKQEAAVNCGVGTTTQDGYSR